MIYRTHFIGGVAAYAVVSSYGFGDPAFVAEVPQNFGYLTVAGVAAITNDLDHEDSYLARRGLDIFSWLGHRGLTHSLTFMAVMSVLLGGLWYALTPCCAPYGSLLRYFVALLCGWGSHILLDFFSDHGVTLFWPKPARYDLAFVKTGKQSEWFFQRLLIILVVGAFILQLLGQGLATAVLIGIPAYLPADSG